jgi:hypothetical protein
MSMGLIMGIMAEANCVPFERILSMPLAAAITTPLKLANTGIGILPL